MSIREKILLILTIIVIVGIFAYKYLLQSQIEKWKNIESSLQKENERLVKVRRLIAQRENVITEYTTLKRMVYFGEDDNQINRQVPELLSQIEDIAKITKVHIVNLKPSIGEAEKSIRTIDIDISVTALLDNIVNFIYNIENHSPIMEIRSLQIYPIDTEKGTIKIQMLISIPFVLTSELAYQDKGVVNK